LIFIFCAARREDERKKRREKKKLFVVKKVTNERANTLQKMMMMKMKSICMHTHASRSYKKADDSIFCVLKMILFERFRPGRIAFVVGDVPDERAQIVYFFLSQSFRERALTFPDAVFPVPGHFILPQRYHFRHVFFTVRVVLSQVLKRERFASFYDISTGGVASDAPSGAFKKRFSVVYAAIV
jgi:hypothetical protein|tara:strand:- start:111 stop:662 length:552 start_codon:yes stop_codon:yes gene_type:complete